MGKFWTTDTKRITTFLSVGILAWFALSLSFEAIPTFDFLIRPLFGTVSLLTIAAFMSVYSLFMLAQGELA